ncbi:hypothetical protein BGZ68_003389 [Mortierella alpina]|nr:hypothetical protein BGZ68_003389 [Mortierella alpina]
MGSRLNRQAPDMFSIELELQLPQDHFLPAQNIVAEVWTNILHKLNPDGPEVWAAVPMRLSHVIPGKSIAVFATRFQPTGRGEFGLTARWKSHKDLTEWQWAPTAAAKAAGSALAAENSNHNHQNNNAINGGDDESTTGDVQVTVRVPRNIAGSSSWTIGPQSVLVWGQHGPRAEGYGGGAGVGGPGLYLGNHAAATRARISGYEAVLSLVGDLLDFDEKIPESDKDVHKKVWLEQARAKDALASPPKRFSALSRSSSISSYGVSSLADAAALGDSGQARGANGAEKGGMARRLSVSDFMAHHEPGDMSDEILAAVVTEPEEAPRLTRKNSVTDMIVPLPKTSKRMSRASASMSSITSIDEYEQEDKPKELLRNHAQAQAHAQDEATPATAALTSPAPNTASKTSQGHGTTNGSSGTSTAKGSHGKKGSTASATSAAVLPPAPSSTTTTATPPPLSKKAQKAAAAAAAAAAASALPPTSAGKSGKSSSASPTVTSLAVQPMPGASATATDAASAKKEDTPPVDSNSPAVSGKENGSSSSGKIAPSLLRSQGWESQQALSTLSGLISSGTSGSLAAGFESDYSSAGNGTDDDERPKHKKKVSFSHKVISLPPGAHNKISDAALKEAVEFLKAEVGQGKKVLVHCRDGNGRSGSVAVAYIAAQMKEQRQTGEYIKGGGGLYDEALKEIWKWKCDVYPHKGLRESVERIQW